MPLIGKLTETDTAQIEVTHISALSTATEATIHLSCGELRFLLAACYY